MSHRLFLLARILHRSGTSLSRRVRCLSSTSLRNIGIFAHVDAGKTTLTERFLFYANARPVMGNVDTGDTATDFLEQERARGITIQSACVRLSWNQQGQTTHINLVDTPGHVDFSAEVGRGLRVIDGAVVVLDAVKGVQAQTEAIWMQAEGRPRIVFVNKMDRMGASMHHSVVSLQRRFPRLCALPLHVPVFCAAGTVLTPSTGTITATNTTTHADARFCGVLDILERTLLYWDLEADPSGGQVYQRKLGNDDIPEGPHAAAVRAARATAEAQRTAVVETVANLDDAFGEMYLIEYDCDASRVPANIVHEAIARLTHDCVVTPVLCGTALKKTGMQPLLDAVVRYLPAPPTDADRKPLRALAFKITHDTYRGFLVFVRVFSGVLKRRDTLRCVSSTSSHETVGRLLHIQAAEDSEVEALHAGDIGAVLGLRSAVTGDTLVAAKDRRSDAEVALEPIMPPVPCVSCSIEADSVSQEGALVAALEQLEREDPSLRIVVDEDMGQTLLQGMGELHLEIVYARLVSDFGIRCSMSEVRVNFRETVASPIDQSLVYPLRRGSAENGASEVRIRVRLEPTPAGLSPEGESPTGYDRLTNNRVRFEMAGVDVADDVRIAVERGCLDALARGPLFGFPLMDVTVSVGGLALVDGSTMSAEEDNDDMVIPELTPRLAKELALAMQTPAGTAIAAAAGRCVSDSLRANVDAVSLLEPICRADLMVRKDFLGDVMADVSARRRGMVLSYEASGASEESRTEEEDGIVASDGVWIHHVGGGGSLRLDAAVPEAPFGSGVHLASGDEHATTRDVYFSVFAEMPLLETLGYATALRSRTAGTGHVQFRPTRFDVVPQGIQERLKAERKL